MRAGGHKWVTADPTASGSDPCRGVCSCVPSAPLDRWSRLLAGGVGWLSFCWQVYRAMKPIDASSLVSKKGRAGALFARRVVQSLPRGESRSMSIEADTTGLPESRPPIRAEKGEEGTGRQVLSATFWSRCGRSLASRPQTKDLIQCLLVAWERREAVSGVAFLPSCSFICYPAQPFC